MRRLEHTLLGLGVGLSVAHVIGADPLLGALVSVAGASLPDFDRHWAPRNYVPRPGSKCRFNEHRGPLHGLITGVVLGYAISLFFPWWVGVLLCLGHWSHCAADGISYAGIPYLWPLTAKRFRLLPYGFRVRSGTTIIELPLALSALAIGLYVALFL